MRFILLALIAVVATADLHAEDSPPPAAPESAPKTAKPAPRPARPYTVKCAPTINVWVEVDRNSLPARQPTNPENHKRVQFKLIESRLYRGDAVLCNYGTRRRDVAVSYTVHCPQPRQERGHRHSYNCR